MKYETIKSAYQTIKSVIKGAFVVGVAYASLSASNRSINPVDSNGSCLENKCNAGEADTVAPKGGYLLDNALYSDAREIKMPFGIRSELSRESINTRLRTAPLPPYAQ
jgi:hypothetical protein